MKHQYVLTPVIMQIDSRGSGPMDITLVDDNEDAVVLRLAVNDVTTRYESQINRRTITRHRSDHPGVQGADQDR